MTKHKIYRLIPHQEFDDDDFDRLAKREGWRSLAEIEEDEDAGQSRELVYSTNDGETNINVADDIYSGIRYVAFTGRDAAALYTRLSQDKEWFYDRDSILAAPAYANDPKQSIRAIYHVGVSAPPDVDDEYLKLFDAFLDDPDPEVRKETVTAMAYPDWPELRPLIERVRQEDPDDEVRAAADEFLNYREDESEEA